MSPGGRRLVSSAVGGLTAAAAILVVCPLLLIFGFLLYQGVSALNPDFFLHLPKPVGEAGGGVANAIVGSLIVIGLAVAVGLPIGIRIRPSAKPPASAEKRRIGITTTV